VTGAKYGITPGAGHGIAFLVRVKTRPPGGRARAPERRGSERRNRPRRGAGSAGTAKLRRSPGGQILRTDLTSGTNFY
jgi:hypothetical protein